MVPMVIEALKRRSGAAVASASLATAVGRAGAAVDGLGPEAADIDRAHAVPRRCRATGRLHATVQDTHQVAASDGRSAAAFTQLHARSSAGKTSVRRAPHSAVLSTGIDPTTLGPVARGYDGTSGRFTATGLGCCWSGERRRTYLRHQNTEQEKINTH